MFSNSLHNKSKLFNTVTYPILNLKGIKLADIILKAIWNRNYCFAFFYKCIVCRVINVFDSVTRRFFSLCWLACICFCSKIRFNTQSLTVLSERSIMSTKKTDSVFRLSSFWIIIDAILLLFIYLFMDQIQIKQVKHKIT